MNWRALPSLPSLRAFAALAEAGGASAAGAALNVSHAAISQQVRALERDLGVRLVRRDGRRLGLTPEGEALSRAALSGFRAIAAEAERLRQSEERRSLRVTTTPSFAAQWLMPRIGAFRSAHPEIGFTLDPSVEREELGPGAADVAIRFGHGRWRGVDAELLAPSDFVVIAAPVLLGDRNVAAPGDLADLPWLQELGTTEVDDWLASRGVTRAPTATVVTMPGTLIIPAALRGDGVTAVARAFVRDEIENGTLRCLFAETDRANGYYLVTPKAVLSSSARAFITWARREAKLHPGGA